MKPKTEMLEVQATISATSTLPTLGTKDHNVAREVLSDDQRYEQKILLGAGGMGEVRLYLDHRIGREVAVKIAHSELQTKPDSLTRFIREAKLQGQLEHPSIVPVYDVGSTQEG